MQDNNEITTIEKEAYEDLTQLYRHFKKQILILSNLLARLASHYADPSENEQLVQQIYRIRGLQDIIFQKYENRKQYIPVFKMIFYRFFCRLIELIQNESKKLISDHFSSLKQFLKGLEIIIYNAVSGDKTDAYLGTLHRIFEQFNVFCQNITFKPNDQFTTQQNPIPKRSLLLEQYPHKIIKKLTDAFILHNCLELDSNNFQSIFYLSRSNTEEVYRLMTVRNKEIKNQIEAYQKNYSGYLLKKNKKKILLNMKFQSQISESSQSDLLNGFYSKREKLGWSHLQQQKEPLIFDKNEIYETIINETNDQNNCREWTKIDRMRLENFKQSQKKFAIRANKASIFFSTRKINDINRTMQDGFQAGKHKINLQTKKILLKFNKLPLRPLKFEPKPDIFLQQRRKFKHYDNSTRKKLFEQLFEGKIQGRRIADTKKCETESSPEKFTPSIHASKKGHL